MSEQLHLEIAASEGLYLTQAARRFPSYRRGRPVSLSCLVRWVQDGVRAADGSRVRLEAARLASRWITTPGAITRFLAAQNSSPESSDHPGPMRRTPSASRKAAERDGAELTRMGVA